MVSLVEQKVASKWCNLSMIDNGVIIMPSSFGNGLYAAQQFHRGNVITEYSGTIISDKTARSLRADKKATHVRKLDTHHVHIDGLKVPVAGMGGASFSNHRDRNDEQYNARLWCVDYHRIPSAVRPLLAPRKERRDEVTCSTHAFLVAEKDITIGSEICCSYGDQYWDSNDEVPSSDHNIIDQKKKPNTRASSSAAPAVAAATVPAAASIAIPAAASSSSAVAAVNTARAPLSAIAEARYRTRCITCQKQFDYPSRLRRHTNTHLKRRAHACALCSRTFTDSSNARRCAARGCTPSRVRALLYVQRRARSRA
jgi:hypothetical protein